MCYGLVCDFLRKFICGTFAPNGWYLKMWPPGWHLSELGPESGGPHDRISGLTRKKEYLSLSLIEHTLKFQRMER